MHVIEQGTASLVTAKPGPEKNFRTPAFDITQMTPSGDFECADTLVGDTTATAVADE